MAVHSPFSTFSRLYSLKFPESLAGIILFLLITIGMMLEPRFFCRFLYPMGAVFSLLPVLPFSVIKRDRENCIKSCQACKMVCPASLDIPSIREGDNHLSGECFSCGKCIGRCPRQHVGNSLGRKAWLPMLAVKSALLFVIFFILYSV